MKTLHAILCGFSLFGALGCAQMSFEAGATRGEAGPVGTQRETADPTTEVAPAIATPIPAQVPAVARPGAEPRESPSPTLQEPSTRVRVASWWKFGGTPATLEADMQACAADLGAGHHPESAGTVVTAGMRDCLRARGWRGAGESAIP